MDDEHIDRALRCIEQIGQAGFLVYVVLHRYQDADGMIQTTQRDLMSITGQSIATVNKAVNALIGAGLIAVKRHKHSVTTVQILKSRNSIFDNTSTLLTTNNIYTDSTKEIEVIKSRNLEFDNLKKKNGSFTLADAQAVLTELTGWMRIPGNPDASIHALGVVQDIHNKHKDKTLEYLRPFWNAFRERYPRSTHIYWLTDWAVQGVIPETKTEQKMSYPIKRTGVIAAERARLAAEEAKRNGNE